MAQSVPTAAYAAFVGDLGDESVGRIFNGFAAATQRGIGVLHLLFESSGGVVSSGVVLYNFFRASPIELHIYNSGGVASAGVLAFLGPRHRYASGNSAFLIHRPKRTIAEAGRSEEILDLGNMPAAEDARQEAIIRAETRIPANLWRDYTAGANVFIAAQEAQQYGLIVAIREFQPPPGGQLFCF